jgi:hypothetical protein
VRSERCFTPKRKSYKPQAAVLAPGAISSTEHIRCFDCRFHTLRSSSSSAIVRRNLQDRSTRVCRLGETFGISTCTASQSSLHVSMIFLIAILVHLSDIRIWVTWRIQPWVRRTHPPIFNTWLRSRYQAVASHVGGESSICSTTTCISTQEPYVEQFWRRYSQPRSTAVGRNVRPFWRVTHCVAWFRGGSGTL